MLKSLPIVSKIVPVFAVLVLQPTALAQTTAAADNEPALKGGVEFSDTAIKAPDLTGRWKGHVFEYHRHPTVEITAQNGDQVSGTYSGILGKFPLSGVIEQTTGTVQLSVDFSRSRLARWKRRSVAVAIFTGQLQADVIIGTATIPEFGDKMVHFEAKKSVKGGETSSTIDQSLQ